MAVLHGRERGSTSLEPMARVEAGLTYAFECVAGDSPTRKCLPSECDASYAVTGLPDREI